MNIDTTNSVLLYYPDFHPDVRWLKSVLLFVDEIKRIVPTGVGTRDPEALKVLIGELQGGLTEISPRREDTVPDRGAIERLDCGFGMIRDRLGPEESRCVHYKTQIRPDGQWEAWFDGYTFLYDQKVSDKVRTLLERHMLIRPDIDRFAGKLANRQGTSVVNQDAANLLLSRIADRIARRNGLISITDQPLGFAMNSLDSLDYPLARPAGIAEGGLAALVAPLFVPAHVHEIPISEYKLIRRYHIDVRAAFAAFLREYVKLLRLDCVEDLDVLQTKLSATAKDLEKELATFRKSRAGRGMGQLCRLTLTGLADVAKAFTGPLLDGVVSVSVKMVDGYMGRRRDPAKDNLFRLVTELDTDIRALGTVEEMQQALANRSKRR